MALIKCPECGGTVSSFADKCPHCGHPVSLQASINASEQYNERLYREFEEMYSLNPMKSGEFYSKAQNVKYKADNLFNYLQSFKSDLIYLAHEDYSDTRASGEYAIKGGHHLELKNLIADYRGYITDMIRDRDSELRNSIKATLATDDAYNAKEHQSVTWEVAMFDDVPVGAVMALLTKMQNDVRTTEGLIIDYLLNQTDMNRYYEQ